MLFLCFLNAHKKAEFRGALFGGYNSVALAVPGVTAGCELGARVNIKNNFFVNPTFAADYSFIYSWNQNKFIHYAPIHLLCKIGGGNQKHSGYGIVGLGVAPGYGDSRFIIAPFLNLGGGYEYRKKILVSSQK